MPGKEWLKQFYRVSNEEMTGGTDREKGRVDWKISQGLQRQQEKAYGWVIVCLYGRAQHGMKG
jgi:hypothetical protein